MPELKPTPGSQSARILVVEEEMLVRIAVAEELRRLGMAVFEADCADGALACLAAHSTIDLVFADVEIPGTLDGLGLALLLRRSHPGLPVILTSGRAASQDLSTFLFIPKPFDYIAVALAIVEALSDAAMIRSRVAGSQTQVHARHSASEIGRAQADIRFAELLIDRHGIGAEAEARSRVQSLARQGDFSAVASWWRILAAVQDLQRPERQESASPDAERERFTG